MSRLHLLLAPLAAAVTLATAAPADAGPHRCGTPELLRARARPPAPPPVLAGGPIKLERDAFGGGHGVRTSANFAVKWQSAALTDDQAQRVLDALEEGWRLYIDELGHSIPTGANAFLLNAYVSGPADNPGIDWGGGYAWIDDDGYPYLVISADLIGEAPEALAHVVNHELYHDVQLGLDAYWEDSAFWFWEATAEWAAQQLYPASARPYGFVGAYALTTELPLFLHSDPFGDPLVGVHQYGSSIVPRHVTDATGIATLIPETWELGGISDDPLVVLASRLPGTIEGGLAGLFADHAARNAAWDYPHRELSWPWVERYAEAFPERTRAVAQVGPGGTGGLVAPPAARALRGWGFHLIELARPASGAIEVEVRGDASGSSGSPATWHAVVVREPAEGAVYTPVALTGGAGVAAVTVPADEARAWLVVAVTGPGRDMGETFAYRYRVGAATPEPEPEPEPEPDPEPEPAGCCSIGTGGGGAGGVPGAAALALAVALVLGARRSRPGNSSCR